MVANIFTTVSAYLAISGHFIRDIPAWVWLTLLIIGLLVAPFLAWRVTYKAKLQAEKERDELKSKDAELQRQKAELEVEELKSKRPIIGQNGWPRAV